MAGKSNTSATFFAQKKLLGKAHTSNLKVDGEELIGSNIQAASSLVFGEAIPTSPQQDLFLLQSASNATGGTVEFLQFSLQALTGTTYDADNAGGGAGSDSGESSQSSGPHTYKFVMPADYAASSSNPRRNNGTFNSKIIVHHTLGGIQLVPPFFSQDSPNPFIVKLYKDDGSGDIGDEIPLLDNIDWNVDYYNGILFLQDYDVNKVPAHAKAFIYSGKMVDEVIASASSDASSASSKVLVFNEKLGGTVNGFNTLFTLANTPAETSEVSIFVNGQLQTPAGIHTFQDYSITGSSVFFTTGAVPPTDSLILAIYNKSA